MPLGDDAMTGYLNVDVRHQLADLTSAVDEILALYRLGVYRRIVAAFTVNQFGTEFAFDGLRFFELLTSLNKAMPAIQKLFSSITNMLTILPIGASLRAGQSPQHLTAPPPEGRGFWIKPQTADTAACESLAPKSLHPQ